MAFRRGISCVFRGITVVYASQDRASFDGANGRASVLGAEDGGEDGYGKLYGRASRRSGLGSRVHTFRGLRIDHRPVDKRAIRQGRLGCSVGRPVVINPSQRRILVR